MPGPYRRVPGEEVRATLGGPAAAAAPSSGNSSAAASLAGGAGTSDGGVGQPTRTPSERLLDKAYALVWVVTAAIVIKLSNTPSVFLYDKRVIRPLLHAALVLIGINTVLVIYLAIYLPKIKGIQDSSAWDVYCPRVVPSMALFGVVAAILLIRCTWPVWGFLSPLILGAEALGALFALHFVPWLP
mmetsp:Transcript_33749/g.99429  ORF Transcript_33749/g.99429 Transcript_33749/m.99429 type:complete len:186 (+) Transcript_33749:46-603(+)